MAETAGYSGTPLVKKLGIKEGFQISLIGEPDDYLNMLTGLPGKVKIHKNLNHSDLDMVHLFVNSRGVLEEVLGTAKRAIKKSGIIWASWPKKASGMPTDLTENMIRELALESGLVDVKVCAIDEIWSGLKLVYRLKDR